MRSVAYRAKGTPVAGVEPGRGGGEGRHARGDQVVAQHVARQAHEHLVHLVADDRRWSHELLDGAARERRPGGGR